MNATTTTVKQSVNNDPIKEKLVIEMDHHQKMVAQGIPVWRAVFQSAVNNAEDVPENEFSTKSGMKSKHVKMWMLPGGLLCLHKEKYFFVPSANIRWMNFE